MEKKKIKYPYEFDEKKRVLSKVYMKGKIIKSIINGEIIPIIFFIILLVSGFSVFLRDFAMGFGDQIYLFIPIYVFIFTSLLTIITFPLNFYSGYVYEHKYGLSRHTKKSWFKDFFKSLILGYIFTIPIITALYFIMGTFAYWWVIAGIAALILFVFFDTIFPVIIFPIFYKTERFKDKKQRDRLLKMVKEAGAKNIENVVLAKESEKSVKANAMFAGLGKTKRIILFDTLINNFTPDETETVVAHELGHYVNKDVWRFIIIEAVKIFPVLFIIDFVLSSSVGLFGITGIADIAGLPLFLLAYNILELVLLPFVNTYSRKREMLADTFALDVSRKPEAQISTEKRLADLALGDDNPNPWVELFLFTHPSVSKRIKNVETWVRKRKAKS